MFFGGCPGIPEDMCGGSWTKLAATVMVELGKVLVYCMFSIRPALNSIYIAT